MSTTTQPAWADDRPARNRNPADLRPRSQQPPWPGQVAVDTGPGGPFAIFASVPDGWAALGLWLLLAHDQWHLTTVRQMIGTFAPWTENDAGAYTATVCQPLGITADTPVDPYNPIIRRAMMKAMAHVEDYKVQWSDDELDAGNTLVTALWPKFLAEYLAGQSASPRAAPTPVASPHTAEPSTESEADRLNDAVLAAAQQEDGTT